MIFLKICKRPHHPILPPLLAASFLAGACSQQTDSLSSSDGWVSLFDGNSFNGWEMKSEIAERIWSIKDGVIDCDPIQGRRDDKNLWSEDEFGDFELHVEWRIKGSKAYTTPLPCCPMVVTSWMQAARELPSPFLEPILDLRPWLEQVSDQHLGLGHRFW